MRPRIEEPFNPLEKANLATSVADALLARPVLPLPPEERFLGVGIYALYYTGSFPPYARIAERNRVDPNSQPIYVGKVFPGERRGGVRRSRPSPTPLYSRLVQHARSINQSTNLDPADFACRFLVVDEIWVTLAEKLLIGRYKPLWNVLIDGFGMHAPGRKGRGGQKRSAWDELHQGRGFAEGRPAHGVAAEELQAKIENFFESAEFADEVTGQLLGAEDDSGVV